MSRRRHSEIDIAQRIMECGGNLYRTAFFLGISRSYLYREIHKLELWPVVHRARKEAYRREKEN